MKIALLIIAAVVLFDIWFVYRLWLVAEMKERRAKLEQSKLLTDENGTSSAERT